MATNGTFVANCDFESIDPNSFRGDTLGVDRYTEKWKGSVDKLAAFLATLTEGAAHPTFSKMFLAAPEHDDDPIFPTVTLEWIGFRSGAGRGPFYKANRTVQTAQTSATVDGVQYSASVQFYAPTGAWEWWEFTEPNPATAAHASVQGTVNPLESIFAWDIKAGNGSTASAQVPLAALSAVLGALSVIESVQDYQAEPVIPGKLWHCTSTTIRTLQGV